MIKKMKTVWFDIFCMIFFIIVGYQNNLKAHAGQRMQLFAEVSQSEKAPRLAVAPFLATSKELRTIATEAEFVSLICNPVAKPIVMMIGTPVVTNAKNLDVVCGKAGVSFYAVDVEKNNWMISWLAKHLSYTAQSFPLFLFFQGKELLLPLCHGNLAEDALLQVIQKKFKQTGAVQGIALQKNDSLKSVLFPQVDFVLTATSTVKMK